jgi:plasmid stabilization system protein ParE
MEVVWSETALETFFKVVDYLFENWSVKEIETFENNVDDLLEKLKTHNQLCPQSNLYGYRKCVIDQNNSLVYSLINNTDTIFLVTFIDNRSQTIF